MIVTLSGVTGTGKSFFKNTISEELGFKNGKDFFVVARFFSVNDGGFM